MIFHMRDGVFQRFDLKTGALLWTATGKGAVPYTSNTDAEQRNRLMATNIAREITAKATNEKFVEEKEQEISIDYAPMLKSSCGDRFYAPYQRSLASISLASGECLWKDPPRLGGSVAQMEETPAGLLVRTVDPIGEHLCQRVLLLDAETGAVRKQWPKSGLSAMSHSPWTDATNFLVEPDRVVIAAEGKLRAADLGMAREQALTKLKFDGTDEASALLSVPGGYSVIGWSNLGIYAKANGERTKKYYRDPPSDNGLGLGLLLLSAATKGWVPPQLGFEALDYDLSASERRESFAYFLVSMTEGKNTGRGIVRVRVETGDVAGEVYFGKRTPAYEVDSEGRLYFMADSKTMCCYRF
jgi:hypothetical protein